MPVQTRLRFAFDIFVIAFFVYTGYDALDFRTLSRYLPLTVSVLGIIIAGLALLIDWWNWRSRGAVLLGDVPSTAAMHGAEEAELGLIDEMDTDSAELDEDVEDPKKIVKRAGIMALWILGYVAAISVVGILAASALFLVVYLFVEARAGWKVPVFGTLLILAGMTILKEALNLQWPEYLIAEFFDD